MSACVRASAAAPADVLLGLRSSAGERLLLLLSFTANSAHTHTRETRETFAPILCLRARLSSMNARARDGAGEVWTGAGGARELYALTLRRRRLLPSCPDAAAVAAADACTPDVDAAPHSRVRQRDTGARSERRARNTVRYGAGYGRRERDGERRLSQDICAPLPSSLCCARGPRSLHRRVLVPENRGH